MLFKQTTTIAALAVFVGSTFALLPLGEQSKEHKQHKATKEQSKPASAPANSTSSNNTATPFDEVGAIPMTFKCGKFNKANTNCGFDTSKDSEQMWVAVPSTAGHAVCGGSANMFVNGKQAQAVIVSTGNDPSSTWTTNATFTALGLDCSKNPTAFGLLRTQ